MYGLPARLQLGGSKPPSPSERAASRIAGPLPAKAAISKTRALSLAKVSPGPRVITPFSAFGSFSMFDTKDLQVPLGQFRHRNDSFLGCFHDQIHVPAAETDVAGRRNWTAVGFVIVRPTEAYIYSEKNEVIDEG